LEPILNGRPGLRGSEPGIAGEPTYGADGDTTSDGSAAPAKFAYTARDQLSSITPHGGTATAIVSHGTGQEDLAAIGSEENIQNVLGVASTGTGTSATYYTRTNNGQLLAKRKPGEKPTETQYYLLDPSARQPCSPAQPEPKPHPPAVAISTTRMAARSGQGHRRLATAQDRSFPTGSSITARETMILRMPTGHSRIQSSRLTI
jgi:hypothetical protein